MKIAYSLVWSAAWGGGILKKVMTQAAAWRAAGHDARVFMLSYQESVAETAGALAPDVPLVVRRCRGTADRFVQYEPLMRLVRAWRPDLVYHRYAGYFPAVTRAAAALPMALEINTDDLEEYRLERPYRDWYNRLTRARLLGRARGMVFVSGELAERPGYARFGLPGLVVGNGIDLARYRVLPPADNPAPRLVFIGSQHEPWHGLDHLLSLAARCPDWSFDLVGAADTGLARPNVRLHGYLERAAYEPIFARADVAIGTLALYRKRMDEASPLKVREYLAFGLPTIIGYRDTDFPRLPPGMLAVPNAPDGVLAHIDAVRSFVERVRGARIPREHVAHLDTRAKEARRLAFLEHLASG